MVELDVQLSKDMVPVIYHDYYVNIAMKVSSRSQLICLLFGALGIIADPSFLCVTTHDMIFCCCFSPFESNPLDVMNLIQLTWTQSTKSRESTEEEKAID